jgi:hypothetical protein
MIFQVIVLQVFEDLRGGQGAQKEGRTKGKMVMRGEHSCCWLWPFKIVRVDNISARGASDPQKLLTLFLLQFFICVWRESQEFWICQ